MHELSITEHILEYAIGEAKRQHASRIQAIRLRIGSFSGIVPECIQMYSDLLAEGTLAEGVRIEATVLPLKVRCRECGTESEITSRSLCCPCCRSLKLQRLSGREFMIESLVIEDGNQSTASGYGME